MIERHIIGSAAEDPLLEAPAQTRERLKDRFPRGATRRMTQLGMLIGSVLHGLPLSESDTIVYATRFAENQALEEYLASFPTPSPTLFQTSIHPSAVQQVLIARQQPIRELFPLTGNAELGAQGLQTALLAPSPRVILCGGEERGTWLREHGSASEETFAFALALSQSPAGGIGKIVLRTGAAGAPPQAGFSLRELFEAIRDHRSIARPLNPGVSLEVSWL